jgi:hypothetical protein
MPQFERVSIGLKNFPPPPPKKKRRKKKRNTAEELEMRWKIFQEIKK